MSESLYGESKYCISVTMRMVLLRQGLPRRLQICLLRLFNTTEHEQSLLQFAKNRIETQSVFRTSKMSIDLALAC